MSRSIKVTLFLSEIRELFEQFDFLLDRSSTLIAAPAGACHSAHSCVAALEKGEAGAAFGIPFALRLAVIRMTNSHSQRLNVTVH
jgi:hypothetical protein